MPILGIVDSSKRVSTDTGAMFPLQVVTVDASGASSVTFSNIPSTYAHLQIRGFARGLTSDDVVMNINGDTASNYNYHNLNGNGSTVASAGYSLSTIYVGRAPVDSATANVYGIFILDILDYANTSKNKTVKSLTGVDLNGSGIIELASGLWRNTSAITSLTFKIQSGNLKQYSQFALYGVKSA